MQKRFLSLFLTFLMLFSLCNISARGENDNTCGLNDMENASAAQTQQGQLKVEDFYPVLRESYVGTPVPKPNGTKRLARVVMEQNATELPVIAELAYAPDGTLAGVVTSFDATGIYDDWDRDAETKTDDRGRLIYDADPTRWGGVYTYAYAEDGQSYTRTITRADGTSERTFSLADLQIQDLVKKEPGYGKPLTYDEEGLVMSASKGYTMDNAGNLVEMTEEYPAYHWETGVTTRNSMSTERVVNATVLKRTVVRSYGSPFDDDFLIFDSDGYLVSYVPLTTFDVVYDYFYEEPELVTPAPVEELTEAERYAKAEALMASGDKAHAAMVFGALGEYKDSKDRSFALWREIILPCTLSAGAYNTVGIRTDGTAVSTVFKGNNSDNYGQCNLRGWTDMVSINASDNQTVGVREDGTVLAVGENDCGQCNVSGWTDIVAAATGYKHTVGLKANGTVTFTGQDFWGDSKVQNMTDIVSIATGCYHVVGLKSDGTVVVVGSNNYGQGEVKGWTDIVAITAADNTTFGLKSDGTFMACGENLGNYSNWTEMMAIDGSARHVVGLKSDGTVLATGVEAFHDNEVGDWTDIVAIAAGDFHTVGMKSDGTFVAIGNNSYGGQCNITDWTDIRRPGT